MKLTKSIFLTFLGSLSLSADVITSPPSINVSAGQTISVNASVSNISDLYAFQLDWIFDPAILTVVSQAEGAFLPLGGTTSFIAGTVNNVVGIIGGMGDLLLGPVPGVSGSGNLAQTTFVARANGTTTVSFQNVVLLDSSLNLISSSNVPDPSTRSLFFIGILALGLLSGVRLRPKRQWLCSLFTVALLGCALRAPLAAQTAPFNQCPHVGLDSSCRVLIVIDATGGLRVLTDTNASPTYDGADDTLIGVLNLSPNPIKSIPLHGPNIIFGFDGDGVCSSSIQPHPAACPFGSTAYEGPGVSFSGISSDYTSGTVNFSPSIAANGGSAWFGLELAIQTQCGGITPPAALKQGDPVWANNQLGPSATTIGAYGCYLTDLAMEINYYAQKQGKAFRTDPAKLNTFLSANGGIDNTGAIPWSKVPLVTGYARTNGVTMYFGGLIDHRDDFTLDQYLCNGYPPMLYVGNPHWVFATGQAISPTGHQTYADIDPDSWPNGDTLDNAAWNNTYRAMVLFSDIIGPLRGLYVTGHSPIELLMTAPDGTQTGVNPVTGTHFNGIPSSGYIDNQLANDTTHGPPVTPALKDLAIIGAQDGVYNLQLFGTGTGPYTIDITAYDVNGTPKIRTLSGTTIPGLISKVTVQYSGSAGASPTVTAPCAGDVNSDGVVNGADFGLVQAAFGSVTGSSRYSSAADVNHDGKVDILDLSFVSRQIGCTTSIQ